MRGFDLMMRFKVSKHCTS